jgi:hypothetical protein
MSLTYHTSPELLNSLILGLYNYYNNVDPSDLDELASTISDLNTANNTYLTTYDTNTNCLSTLWSSVQTSITNHEAIYLGAGFTHTQIDDIATSNSMLIS